MVIPFWRIGPCKNEPVIAENRLRFDKARKQGVANKSKPAAIGSMVEKNLFTLLTETRTATVLSIYAYTR